MFFFTTTLIISAPSFQADIANEFVVLRRSEAILTLKYIVLHININRLTCEITIGEADYNAGSLTAKIKQLVDAHIGSMVSVLSDRQYIKTFLQAILQKLGRKHTHCGQRA